MEERPHPQRDRAAGRRVQAQDQDANGASIGRHGGHVVLGFTRLGADRHGKVDGWDSLPPSQAISRLTSQLDQIFSKCRRLAAKNFNHLPDGTPYD
jgi:hypothetical protein